MLTFKSMLLRQVSYDTVYMRAWEEMFPLAILLLGFLPLCLSDKGSCPPTLPVDICDAACGPQLPCKNTTQICCPTACGGAMCVDAVTKRHFVTLVKPGQCPEFPKGVWVCSHSCTSDSDCPRALKCCTNRCGALACQKPDADAPS